MRRLLVLSLVTFPLIGCRDGTTKQESTAFARAKEIIGLFLDKDVQYTLNKTHEYQNNGGTTVKGICAANGHSYKWTLAFDSAGKVTAFNFDAVSFLAQQPAGHLSFLPENKKYVKNDVIVIPSMADLRKARIEAKEGF